MLSLFLQECCMCEAHSILPRAGDDGGAGERAIGHLRLLTQGEGTCDRMGGHGVCQCRSVALP